MEPLLLKIKIQFYFLKRFNAKSPDFSVKPEFRTILAVKSM